MKEQIKIYKNGDHVERTLPFRRSGPGKMKQPRGLSERLSIGTATDAFTNNAAISPIISSVHLLFCIVPARVTIGWPSWWLLAGPTSDHFPGKPRKTWSPQLRSMSCCRTHPTTVTACSIPRIPAIAPSAYGSMGSAMSPPTAWCLTPSLVLISNIFPHDRRNVSPLNSSSRQHFRTSTTCRLGSRERSLSTRDVVIFDATCSFVMTKPIWTASPVAASHCAILATIPVPQLPSVLCEPFGISRQSWSSMFRFRTHRFSHSNRIISCRMNLCGLVCDFHCRCNVGPLPYMGKHCLTRNKSLSYAFWIRPASSEGSFLPRRIMMTAKSLTISSTVHDSLIWSFVISGRVAGGVPPAQNSHEIVACLPFRVFHILVPLGTLGIEDIVVAFEYCGTKLLGLDKC